MAALRYPGNSLQQELNQPLGAADELLTSPKAAWISWLSHGGVCFLKFCMSQCFDKEISLHQVLNKDTNSSPRC